MGTIFQAKTVSQKIPWNVVVNTREVLTPNDIYTCPVGKKAQCNLVATCDNLGAATIARIRVQVPALPIPEQITLMEWQSHNIPSGSYGARGRNSKAGVTDASYSEIGIENEVDFAMNADEVINTFQDLGTNASFNIFLRVQETPV